MKKAIMGLILATAILLTASCAERTPQAPPQQSPTESVTTTPITSQTPSGLSYLTDAEKAKAMQIALSTPEAKAVLEAYGTYKPEFGWAAVVYEASGAVSTWQLDYDVVEKGIPSNVPSSATIYPRVRLHFGKVEPGYPEGRVLLDATVDLVNEKTVGHVETHPLKKLPT